MSDKLRLGAFDAETKEYTVPSKAVKGRSYICPDCNKPVIFRKGDIRVHHYAHKAETSQCSYYEHPNESQIHKDAKLLMKKMLDDKKLIGFYWNCYKCKDDNSDIDTPDFIYEEGDKAVLEYRDKNGKWIADVALVNEDKVKCIFEIKYKHKTTTVRPEPWYEIDAVELINDINDCLMEVEKYPDHCSFYNEPDYVWKIKCIRTDVKRWCNTSFCYNEQWVKNIPAFSKYNEINSCLLCEKEEYNPVGIYRRSDIRLCYDCLEKDFKRKKLRSLYACDLKTNMCFID